MEQTRCATQLRLVRREPEQIDVRNVLRLSGSTRQPDLPGIGFESISCCKGSDDGSNQADDDDKAR
jgi:hypothetical protein